MNIDFVLHVCQIFFFSLYLMFDFLKLFLQYV